MAVEREDGSNTSAFSVDYNTTDVTAVAGSDYNSTSGTLSFAANENVKYIPLTILADSAVEPYEYFHVSLKNFQCSNSSITGEITLTPHTGIIIGTGSVDPTTTITITPTADKIVLPPDAPSVVIIDGK